MSEDAGALLERIRQMIGMPASKPLEHVVSRVGELVIERLEDHRRLQDYQGRWAKLCDLLNVSYGADAETALGDVKELQQENEQVYKFLRAWQSWGAELCPHPDELSLYGDHQVREMIAEKVKP